MLISGDSCWPADIVIKSYIQYIGIYQTRYLYHKNVCIVVGRPRRAPGGSATRPSYQYGRAVGAQFPLRFICTTPYIEYGEQFIHGQVLRDIEGGRDVYFFFQFRETAIDLRAFVVNLSEKEAIRQIP